MDKHPKVIFAVRLALYIVIGLFAPVAFLAWKFELFKPNTSNLKISGWGLVVIIFISVFLLYLFNQLRKGMKPGIAKQCVDGIYKITLPLLLVTFIIHWTGNYIEQLVQFFIVVTICETIAIPINPLPKWAAENNIDTKGSIAKQILTKAGIIKDKE